MTVIRIQDSKVPVINESDHVKFMNTFSFESDQNFKSLAMDDYLRRGSDIMKKKFRLRAFNVDDRYTPLN